MCVPSVTLSHPLLRTALLKPRSFPLRADESVSFSSSFYLLSIFLLPHCTSWQLCWDCFGTEPFRAQESGLLPHQHPQQNSPGQLFLWMAVRMDR